MNMIHTGLLFWMCSWHLLGVKTDEVKSVSVKEGDSVTLNPDLQILRDEQTVWRFNSKRIAKVTKSGSTDIDDNERFRGRLKLDQTGNLTITNTRTTDSGLYQLNTFIENKESIKRFNVTVYAKPSTPKVTQQNPSSSKSTSKAESTPSSPSSSSSLIALVSAAAGALLLIVAAGGTFWISRKCRTTDQQVQTRNEEITYADPTFYMRKTQKTSDNQEDEVVYAGVVTRR